MDNKSESLGIYQRLIKFVLGMVSRPTEPRGSSEVPIEEGSSRNIKSFIKPINKPNDFSGSEIVVEFRHINGSERWTQNDQTGPSISAPEKDSRGIGQKKSVTFKESDNQDGERFKKKEANNHLGDHQEIKVNNQQPHEGTTKPRQPRRLRPLLTVASNINEKAETFIESRKKAMNKSYSLDQHEKS